VYQLLYCLVAEEYASKQHSKSCYLTVKWPEVKPASSKTEV